MNNILLFYPKISDFGPILLVIIANIFRYAINHHCAKFHAFIKKWTIRPFLKIIRWTIMHPILWINFMLVFICVVFVELSATGSKQKFKMKICASAGIEPAAPCFPARHSNHPAIGQVEKLLLKLLVYFFQVCFNQSTRVTFHVRNWLGFSLSIQSLVNNNR